MTTIDEIYYCSKNCDIILKSCDDVLFYVSRMVLMSNSPVFHAHLVDCEHMEEISIDYKAIAIQRYLRLFHSTRDLFVSANGDSPSPLNLSEPDHEATGDIMLLFNEYDVVESSDCG